MGCSAESSQKAWSPRRRGVRRGARRWPHPRTRGRGGACLRLAGAPLATPPGGDGGPVEAAGAGGLRSLGEAVEVLEQAVAVFGADRLGVELHPPQRAGGVFDAHYHPVGGPGDLAALLAERAGDGKRVVAHHLEVLGDTREEALSRVGDGGEAAVHDHRRVGDCRFEDVAEPLVAKADTEYGDLGEAQDVAAQTEVVPAVGTAGTGGEDDRVEVPPRERAPGDHVVLHDDRLLAGCGGEQVEDVVGVGVVVVYEQGGHRPGFAVRGRRSAACRRAVGDRRTTAFGGGAPNRSCGACHPPFHGPTTSTTIYSDANPCPASQSHNTPTSCA